MQFPSPHPLLIFFSVGGFTRNSKLVFGCLALKVEKLYFKHLGFANVKPDDLKVIEGIGPKIEGLLKDGGITTWKKLSESQPEEIQVILDAAGPRYKLANPGTWPKQAELAANDKWEELTKLQDELKGGK